MTKAQTKAQLKKLQALIASPEFQDARNAVFVAAVIAQVAREKVDELLNAELARDEWYFAEDDLDTGEDGARITDHNRLWLASDALAARRARWVDHALITLHASGFCVIDGTCPALRAEAAQREAEDALLTLVSSKLGLPNFARAAPKYRARALDLHLRVAA